MANDKRGRMIGVYRVPPLKGKTTAEIEAIAGEFAARIAADAKRRKGEKPQPN